MVRLVNRAIRRSSSSGAVAVTAVVLCGCPSTATTTSSPTITGVEISASTVVASHGCGKERSQIYRYTAVIYHALASDASSLQEPIASNLFECYADGLFSNLPASDSGSSSYVVSVYAYSYATFQGNPTVAALQCPATSPPPCRAETPAVAADPVVTAAADFTFDCTANEEQGVPVLALCVERRPASAAADSGVKDAEAGEAGPGDASAETGQGDP